MSEDAVELTLHDGLADDAASGAGLETPLFESRSVDQGSGALNHFASSWREGLAILTGDQLGIADALEATVEDIVGVDLDVAAALQHVNGDIP